MPVAPILCSGAFLLALTIVSQSVRIALAAVASHRLCISCPALDRRGTCYRRGRTTRSRVLGGRKPEAVNSAL